ncbi:hypothetical protein ACHAXT_007072 [Thalassiosira profunda]
MPPRRPGPGPEPLLPSFSHSRTFTYDSAEDGTCTTAEVDANGFPVGELTTVRSELSSAGGSFASLASAASPGNPTGAGGHNKGGARFHKSAMATRARERRMRRMRGANRSPAASAASRTPDTIGSVASGPLPRIPPVGSSPPGARAGAPAGGRGSPAGQAPTTAQVASAKEHVERMKAAAHASSPPSAPSPTGLAPRTARSRLLERARSRESNASPSTTPGTTASSTGAVEGTPNSGSNIDGGKIDGRRSPYDDIPGTVKPKAHRHRHGGSKASNGRLASNVPPAPSAYPYLPAPQPASQPKSRRPQQHDLSPEECGGPDWGTTGGLSPEEVAAAKNFTNVQFHCSHVGEVEVFSDDGGCGDSVFSSEVSGGVYGERGAGTGRPEGRNDANGANGTTSGAKTDPTNEARTHAGECWQNDVWSDATTPSLLQNNEIFHQKAAASIVKLLTPERMTHNGLMAPEVNPEGQSAANEDGASEDVDGDSPTGVIPNKGGHGVFTFDGDADPSASRGGAWHGTTPLHRALFREDLDDLDDDIKQSVVFRAFRKNMMDPSPQLGELLGQIHRRGHAIDRAFATRRKNACGALKILSAREENRTKVCWTVGVLPALASVLIDVGEEISDELARDANTEARNRAVATLLNLSVSKKNKLLIVNTPGLLTSVAECVEKDNGEGRQGCCTALLYLAKTAEARGAVAKGAGMMEALCGVIAVPDEMAAPTRAFPEEAATPPRAGRKGVDGAPASPLSPGTPGSQSAVSRSSRGSRGSDTDLDRTQSTEADEGPEEVSFETAADVAPAAAEEKPSEATEDPYDADPNRFLHGARLSAFACLLCLVKSKENAYLLARRATVVETLAEVSQRHGSPSHARAMAVLAHLTRHPKNGHHLVYKCPFLLPALQSATGSRDGEARRYAFCALQNLSMDKSCRAPIAHAPDIIWSLTQRCKERPSGDEDEARTAAVATLQNLADEPANLIQFTIVTDCIGTLVRIAREDVARGGRTELTSFMAKNALATLSHWFRKIATSGSERTGTRSSARAQLYHATLEPTGFDQWT